VTNAEISSIFPPYFMSAFPTILSPDVNILLNHFGELG
jgi:hypothetical protein